MKLAPDRSGLRFNALTIVRRHEQNTTDGKARYVCQCVCGGVSVVPWKKLKRGRIKSCGCRIGARKPVYVNRSKKPIEEQISIRPEYGVWRAMKARCKNPGNANWHNYGGRGIAVCPEWSGKKGFKRFLADMGPRPSPSHSIDRINNDGHYEPGNCRWATSKEQCRNTRFNRFETILGVTKCIADWSEVSGHSGETVRRLLGTGRSNRWHRWVDSLTASPLCVAVSTPE
jgi:hypothetical protein